VANLADSDDLRCGGRMFTASEIALICEVVATCRGVSRKELANTIGELLGWRRANGALKEAECLLLLARLQAQGLLQLPAKQQTRPAGSVTSIPHTDAGQAGVPLSGSLEMFAPVCVERVTDGETRQRFRELVGRYHPLGYKVPFGAHLQYLVWIGRPEPAVAGCLQFSSAAWPRFSERDRWSSGGPAEKNHTTALPPPRFVRAEDLQVALKRGRLPFPGKRRGMGWCKCCFFRVPIAAQARWPLGVTQFRGGHPLQPRFPKSNFPHEE